MSTFFKNYLNNIKNFKNIYHYNYSYNYKNKKNNNNYYYYSCNENLQNYYCNNSSSYKITNNYNNCNYNYNCSIILVKNNINLNENKNSSSSYLNKLKYLNVNLHKCHGVNCIKQNKIYDYLKKGSHYEENLYLNMNQNQNNENIYYNTKEKAFVVTNLCGTYNFRNCCKLVNLTLILLLLILINLHFVANLLFN